MAKPILPKLPHSEKLCSVSSCETRHYARSYCKKHYKKFQKYGDPLAVGIRYTMPQTNESHFWSLVDKTPGLGPNGDCWEWTGSLTSKGYGRITKQYKAWLAHRLAWLYVKGEEPEQLLLHSCDNPKCVRIDHLREGTVQDNSRDMVERGRSARGECHPQAKLTIDVVRQIKTRLSEGMKPMAISRILGIPRPTIVSIASGRNWGHIHIEEGCR